MPTSPDIEPPMMRRLIDRLPPTLQRLVRVRVLRVAAAGGLGVLAQTAVFEILGIWLELVQPSTAVIIGAELGILINFSLSNRYAFGDRRHTPLWGRLARFHLVIAGALFIQWLSVFLTEQITRDVYALHAAYFAGIALGFIYNYTGYRLWVWRHTPTS